MSCLRLLAASAIIIVPRLLLAQSTTPVPARPLFFVELRGNYNECEIRYQNSNGVVYINPFPLMVGYYLTPRLAVQLGGSYGHTTDDSPGGIRQDPAGTYVIGAISTKHTHWGIPALLRYAMLAKKSRLQADALLGMMWANDTYNSYSYSTFNGTVIDEQARSDHGSQFIATVGIGLRWVFCRHFELLYDHAWNRNLDGAPSALRQQLTGRFDGLTANRSIALRYRFNLRRPAPEPAQ